MVCCGGFIVGSLESLSFGMLATIVAGCGLLFVVGLATFLGILPLDLSKVRREPAKTPIRWAAATVAVGAAGVLIAPAIALAHEAPARQSSLPPVNGREVSFTNPTHQQPGESLPIIGCGRQQVQLQGALPPGETVVVAARSANATRMQVESDPEWDQADSRWDAVITISDTWKPLSYQLTAYIMSKTWVEYMRTAADENSTNTWWWAATAPPYTPVADEVTVQLDRAKCP
jgi:hypothetical protein